MDDKEVTGLISKIREELASLKGEEDLGEADKEGGEKSKAKKPTGREERRAFKKQAIKGIVDIITDAIVQDIDDNVFEETDIRDLVKDLKGLAVQVEKRESKTTDVLADFFDEMAKQIETWAR